MPSYIQLALTEEHFTAIGRVVAEWSFLDVMLEVAIWGFADLQPGKQRPITVDMRTLQKIKVLGTLSHHRFGNSPKGRKMFDGILSTVQELEAKRNDVVHGDWRKSGDPTKALASRFRRTSKGPGRKKRVEMTILELTAEEIEIIAGQIGELNNDLASFLTVHVTFPPL